MEWWYHFKYRWSFSDLIANFQVKCSRVICIMGEISCKCAGSCSGYKDWYEQEWNVIKIVIKFSNIKYLYLLKI